MSGSGFPLQVKAGEQFQYPGGLLVFCPQGGGEPVRDTQGRVRAGQQLQVSRDRARSNKLGGGGRGKGI